jgi:putative redox protein
MIASDDGPIEGVVVRETGAGKFQTQVRTGSASFLVDEPPAAGGLGSGPTPFELLSASLGACTVMTLRLYATRKGWPLTGSTVRVVHRREGPHGRDRFAREIVLEGELSPEQRARLLEIANRCPVHATLEHGADILTILAQRATAGGLDPEPVDHMAAMETACED